MTEAAKKYNANVIILHSLRYGLYWRKLREIAMSGKLGKIMGIRHVEGASLINYSPLLKVRSIVTWLVLLQKLHEKKKE